MLNKNIETILGCDAEYEDASTVRPLVWRPTAPIRTRT